MQRLNRIAFLCLFVLLIGLTSNGIADDPVAENPVADDPLASGAPPVAGELQELMQDRKYVEAIALIDESEFEPKDYIAYLKGRAYYLDEKYVESITAYDAALADHPDSPWGRRIRFGKALSLARKRDFEAAELIFRSEAEFLLSPERKQEIAQIYLESADAYFDPPEEDVTPDYARALEFYGKALEVGPLPAMRIEVELREAQCMQELGDIAGAIIRYEQFIEEHEDDLQIIEARYLMGECHQISGNLLEARRAWQDLLAAHESSDSERIAEAAFHLAETWNLPTPGSNEQLSLGVAAYQSFLERYSDHELAGEAHLNIARSYIHRGRYGDATDALLLFLNDETFADLEEIPDARNMLGWSYQLQEKYTEALFTWREYLTSHPTHHEWSSVQRDIIETEYLMAEAEYEDEQYDEARRLWGEFLVKYPLSERNPEILYQFGWMRYQEEQWDEAISDWRRLVSKHPGNQWAGLGQLKIAIVTEQELGDLPGALEEYEKLYWSPHANQARAAMARLTRKSLSVATDRVYRSNETPKIRVAARNIEEVTVSVYLVDLETYFRKMHSARGVESLDVALIDPDRTFTVETPDYAEYQEIEHLIPITLTEEAGSGVMAVTVSSETLEATTLLIQSDLDVIVKSSRDELFAFTENMKSGEPWPDVRLLISDGSQVFAEGVSNEDGIFRISADEESGDYEELQNTGDVRVFAVFSGHTASNVIGLSGVGVARGLTDRGYIYTDRPAYRAGQAVHVRGCVRTVVDDIFTVEEGKTFGLNVFDSRNRLIRHDEVALGEYGSFHTHLILPATSPPGEYRVVLQDQEGSSYQGTFIVHQQQLEPVYLTIDTERTVYYRGEDIEGTIKAAYYYGAPLADKTITYQVAGDPRVHEATTDENGEVQFTVPTREFHESQLVSMTAQLPDWNVATSKNFRLSSLGYSIEVDTVRPVYVVGETFEVEVRTIDAEGEPVPRDLVLNVLERTNVDGKIGERLIETHDLKTDEEGGVALATLAVDIGGDIILRAEGVDRFSNSIMWDHIVKISGEDDEVRLRILAEQHTFKVGDQADLRILWRERPALALITYEGTRVLDYQLVRLETGENELSIPLDATLAPNFNLGVAVMIDPPANDEDDASDQTFQRFHSAASPFSVERELNVVVTSKRVGEGEGPIQPGEEIEVSITTTDPQGEPVAAEVSLAMIERSLLDRFSWSNAPIDDFFRSGRRESAFRTTSSIFFSYTPQTTAIDLSLLAERERREILTEESLEMDAIMDTAPAVGFGEYSEPGNATARGGESRRQFDLFAMPEGEEAQVDMAGTLAFHSRQSSGLVADGRGYEARGRSYDTTGGMLGLQELGTMVDIDSDGIAVLSDDLFVLDLNGRATNWSFLSGNAGDVQTISALIEAIEASGATLLPSRGPQETGYWNPSIVTDDQGLATVTFVVPARSTGWTFMAKGITTDTLAGETTDDLDVKKDLFAQMKLPGSFTDGDEAEITVSVHNDLIDEGSIDVVLRTTIAGRTIEEKKTVDVESMGVLELTFPVSLSLPSDDASGESQIVSAAGRATFQLTVSSGEYQDVATRSVPVQPYGIPVYATSGGAAQSDATAWIELPEGVSPNQPSLQVVIGPNVERSLMGVVLGPALPCQLRSGRIASGIDTASSDLIASLALAELLNTTQEAGSPEAQSLAVRTHASLGLLISSQNDDGSWSWTGIGSNNNRNVSARAVWALSLARDAGYEVPDDVLARAVAYLRRELTSIANDDYEGNSLLLFTLATASQGDFSLANRLYRARNSLSPSALAYLALAFTEMDRNETAIELLTLLKERGLDVLPEDEPQPLRSQPWSRSPIEIRALYALGLQAASPNSPELQESVDWLLAHRTGNRWTPDKATGPATLFLSRWFAETRFEGESYALTVSVNDNEVAAIDIDESSGVQTLVVPSEFLTDGRQTVRFQLTGRGRYAYQCVLSDFVAADAVKSSTTDWDVRRTYEPAPLELDGEEIPRGFGILTGNYSSFQNPLTQLPVGRRTLVELEVRRRVAPASPNAEREYLVVTEPIPAGTSVIEQSVQGPYERFEIGPSEITFYIGPRSSGGDIRYELYGYAPGVYRIAPTQVRDAYQPDRLAVSQPKEMTVLPSGEVSTDEYRLSPQELYELGKRHFVKHDWETSQQHLGDLLTNWNLRPDVYKECVIMLLDAHLETGPASQIVHYFEIVKEKWPEVEVPFAKIVKVGAAYHDMGEFERSYLVFRATVEASFRRESGVAGFLESQGEFIQSVDVMQRLLSEYPPESYTAAATYALSQRVYAMAPNASEDEKLREQKITRVTLIHRAWTMLQSFLTANPEDPAADEAAFAAANALIELKDYDRAVKDCERYATRYPESDLLDSFWYIIGYCNFATRQHEEAIEMCRKVSEMTHVDPDTGRTTESPNRWQAIYILGQVHHSLGEAEEAINEYRRVEDRFPDAAEAIDYFTRKDIQLDEVTTVEPGEQAQVELAYRNIASCDVKVYRIDLMKFSLMKRDLEEITRINLAGIRPHHEATIELGDGKDYGDRTHAMQLPLEEEGAYLVVCRGEDLHTSGLVLVTPMEVEVQEDFRSGRLRVTVKDSETGAYLSDVHVKVIGSNNSSFISGETDLRGIFVADGIQGVATVIAQVEPSRYAFFRGERSFGGQAMSEESEPSTDPAGGFDDFGGNGPSDGALLQGLQDTNRKFQFEQQEQLQDVYDTFQSPMPMEKGDMGGGMMGGFGGMGGMMGGGMGGMGGVSAGGAF